jgi:hypothetical protein
VNIYPGFIFTFVAIYGLIVTMKAGTLVHHRDNHQWRGVVVRDLDPRKPVNGVVLLNHNGRVARMHKDLLKVVTKWDSGCPTQCAILDA